jgi:LysM repeat protein
MFGKLLIVVVAGVVLWAAAAHSSRGAGAARTYIVKPDDTLWSIAVAHYGGDPRASVYRLEERNGLTGPFVRPGQKLALP